jgi:hypothetical protein
MRVPIVTLPVSGSKGLRVMEFDISNYLATGMLLYKT